MSEQSTTPQLALTASDIKQILQALDAWEKEQPMDLVSSGMAAEFMARLRGGAEADIDSAIREGFKKSQEDREARRHASILLKAKLVQYLQRLSEFPREEAKP